MLMNQSSFDKDIKEYKNKILYESASSNSDINGEGNESNLDGDSDQDSNRIKE